MRDQLLKLGFKPISGASKIQKGGSARSFFRFADAELGRCIFCEYSDEKAENFLYAPIAEFLASQNVSVPKFYYHDAPSRMLVMQDFGDVDLLDYAKTAPDAALEAAYKAALAEAAKIHSTASAKFAESGLALMPKFDNALYEWEQNYFWENLVLGLFGLDAKTPEAEWANLRAELLSAPECLLHRDFQSQNIIMHEGGVGLIDFQGMRHGVFFYDVASLLFDPYAEISPRLRSVLYNHYCQMRGLDAQESARLFLQCASERLMQALGAYGFLSLKKGRREYLAYLKPALEFLNECADSAGLPETAAIAQSCLNMLAQRPEICEFRGDEK